MDIKQLSGQNNLPEIQSDRARNTARNAANSGIASNAQGDNQKAVAVQNDTVQISSQSQIRAAIKSLAVVPEVRQNKVDAIRQSLADGSFSINNQATAAGILSFEIGQGQT